MGLFSWFLPSPEKRLERAKKHLEAQRFMDAYHELQGFEHEGVDALREQAETGLVDKNLKAAVSWANAGDDGRVDIHLELAERYHRGGLEAQFKSTRRQVRTLRSNREAAAEAEERKAEAKLLNVDPTNALKGGGLPTPQLPDEWKGPDAEIKRAQLALIIENYPEALRPSVANLGPTFAQAVLEMDEGKANEALQHLIALDDSQPLVRYERARVASVLKDPASARRELLAFVELAKGHHPIGNNHTGVMLAQYNAELGDFKEGIRVLLELRKTQPKLGGFLLAQLLTATDDLQGAEIVLRELIKDHPKQTTFYKLMAIVRVKAGFRVDAMNVLERALAATHCAPGTCGYQPPDPEVKRLLATLYLEDNIETNRAYELVAELGPPQKSSWDDQYLNALVARSKGKPNAQKLADRLLSSTPEDHPAHGRAQQYLSLRAG